MEQIYLGYSTAVQFDEEILFCTSLSISLNEQIINSSGSFGGILHADSNNEILGLSSPFKMDYPDIQISLSFQILTKQMDKLKDWIKQRNLPKTIIINIGGQKIQFNTCFFSQISLSTGQNQLLSATINLNIIDQYNTINLLEIYHTGKYNKSLDELGKMYGTKSGGTIIPYYATQITDNEFEDYIIGWSLDLSQNMLKKAYCLHDNNQFAPLPKHVMFSVLECSLKITILNDNNLALGDLSNYVSFKNKIIESGGEMVIQYVDSNSIRKFLTLDHLMLQSITPSISESSSLQQLDLSYISHKIKIN